MKPLLSWSKILKTPSISVGVFFDRPTVLKNILGLKESFPESKITDATALDPVRETMTSYNLRTHTTAVKCNKTKPSHPATKTSSKPSPLQALMAEVMSEAARKSVIAMAAAALLWWMLQPGAVCDHWRAERNYWWQWIDLTPLVSETTSVLLSAVTCSWPLQPTACVCVSVCVFVCVKVRL